MNVTYSDKVKQSGQDYVQLQLLTKGLEEILGRSAHEVSATWDRGEDAAGRTVYTLQLSDWTGPVSAVFAPDELNSSPKTRYRLHRLWDDVLGARIDRQLKELARANGPEG